MRKLPFCYGLILFAIAMSSCTSDALPEPVELPCNGDSFTYETDIRPIIEQSCAYSGCHLGGAPGLYNEYSGLVPVLESGRFQQRVILQRDDPSVGMPPNYAPEGRPLDLLPEQLEMISCWLEAGYPRE